MTSFSLKMNTMHESCMHFDFVQSSAVVRKTPTSPRTACGPERTNTVQRQLAGGHGGRHYQATVDSDERGGMEMERRERDKKNKLNYFIFIFIFIFVVVGGGVVDES